jgi:two-component system, NarL family, response regulator YdfI
LIRIEIIAPGVAVRAGLRALLSDTQNIEIVGEAAYLSEALGISEQTDVLVWSPGQALGLSAVRSELDQLSVEDSIAMLIIHDVPELIEKLTEMPLRAWGVINSESTQAELIISVQALNEGLTVIDPAWIKQIFNRPSSSVNGKDKSAEALTGRELEVLQLLALGLTNKQIAAKLSISAHTVKFHVSTIFMKLGTTNRVETVNLGLKNGLIVL